MQTDISANWKYQLYQGIKPQSFEKVSFHDFTSSYLLQSSEVSVESHIIFLKLLFCSGHCSNPPMVTTTVSLDLLERWL